MEKLTNRLRGPFLVVALIFSLACFKAEAKKADEPYIRISADIKKSGFVGESLVYEVTLESSTPEISNVRTLQSPSFPAGVTVINGVTHNQRPVKKEEKGKTLYCWTIQRSYLIPTKAGKITVGAGKYVAFIPHEKIIYHDFWGSRRTVEYEEIQVAGNECNVKIEDLPKAKSQEGFAGCVGNFDIEGWFPPGRITTGNEAYVVFSIEGYGSLENLKLPNIYKIFGKGCRLKEVEQNEERMQRDGKLYSEITLTCKFVADEEEFIIDPLCLEFFDPTTKKYYTTCSETLKMEGTSSKSKSSQTPKDAISI